MQLELHISVTPLVEHDGEGWEAYDAQFDGATREVHRVHGATSQDEAAEFLLRNIEYPCCMRTTLVAPGVYEFVASYF